ncbi:MAG TPA: electron transfer flavoprotein subunit alpha/FixB family protein [Syntrophales bacterium]|nr:electron transfer flavoprotein subunit alpha/FixB family protein [Syntrophales bacterium]HPL66237.1 electron transfer flavoprotein subunit alpha/FixB family protein [Smithellaceae bacterium]HOH72327.1 electron transfer flavoprotein subunit alpha/FixB family protein [Syntrophales bacterium]HPN08340.1 electron transfer flavoprotein subunit alpha/FixB family protein [Syntrophales bacterium]HPX80361.1 electron transfer flavoprotein subunit alpha/FixB family protein [Syntrophales bacterium]
MADSKAILVVGETEKGKMASITRELLGGARVLADQSGGDVCLLLLGEIAAALASEGISLGADKVYVATNAAYNEFSSDAYTELVSGLCAKIAPALCLMGQTDLGCEVAPRVAARLGAALAMDCVEVVFDAENGRFQQTRPAFGGKALSVLASTKGLLQINTVRAKSMQAAALQDGRKGETVTIAEAPAPGVIKVKLLEAKKTEAEGIKLEDAKVIVSGGGGLGGTEGFAMIKELADLLGGVVGATRVPVDENWVPLSMEIGQTGKIVSPELYIAIGISGAAQHVTGCISSKKIVTINRDPDANMFKISDLGLVADYKAVVPILIEKLKAMNT